MNIGKKSGAVHRIHAERMGLAVYLFDWCLWRQTRTNGLVYGGAPITYAKIKTDTDFNERTLRRWMATLKKWGYIEVTYLNFHQMRIRVLNPKKHKDQQLKLPVTRPDVADSHPATSGRVTIPKVAECLPKVAESSRAVVLSLRTAEPKAAEAAPSALVPPAAAAAAAHPPGNGNGNGNGQAITLPDNPEAWLALGWAYPQGHNRFQQAWLLYFGAGAGQNAPLADRMERCAQYCQAKKVGIPPAFFASKRMVEGELIPKRESANDARQRRTHEAGQQVLQATYR